MIDASLLLKDAIIAALQGHAPLTAINGGRVYETPPPPPEPGEPRDDVPFTSLGEPDATPWGNDGYRGSEVSLQIDNWAEATETAPDHMRVAHQMNIATLNAMWTITLSLDSPADWVLHKVWIDGTRVERDPDGVTAHGIVNIRANITPVITH